MITKTHVTIKDEPAFRVRLEKWECLAPKGLYALDLIQERKDEEGTVIDSSTYNFFMTNEEMKTLAEGLLK